MIVAFFAIELKDLLGVGVIVVLLAMVLSFTRRRTVQLRRIEKKLDALLKQQGVKVPSGLSLEVQRLAREGQKIEAIRLHREQTGVSLRDAKEAVEDFGQQ